MTIRDEILSLVAERSPERIVVLDGSLKVVFHNAAAGKFLDAHVLPEEVLALARRIFDAATSRRAADRFQGPISLYREVGGRRWKFRVAYREEHPPLVCLFFSDETVSSCFDLNAVRQTYRLTRREADVLRHLLDGAKSEEIAEDLGITVQSVKDYLTGVYRKCGVSGRFELLRHFVRSPAP